MYDLFKTHQITVFRIVGIVIRPTSENIGKLKRILLLTLYNFMRYHKDSVPIEAFVVMLL